MPAIAKAGSFLTKTSSIGCQITGRGGNYAAFLNARLLRFRFDFRQVGAIRERHSKLEAETLRRQIDLGLGAEVVWKRTPQQLHPEAFMRCFLRVDVYAAFGPMEDELDRKST